MADQGRPSGQITESRCDCCDLPISGCGKAVEQRQRTQAASEKPRHGAQTNARFPGRCPYCGDDIEPGQQIGYDTEWGWVCSNCETDLAS